MKLRHLLFVLLFGLPALAPAAEPAARIRVLVVDGFSNHDWRLTTRLIEAVLAPTGLFDVAVSTAPPTAASPGWDRWRPAFRDYDVVIQNCNDHGGGPSWPQEVQRDFEAYARAGGGVYIFHSANNAFPNWPAYNEIIGLGWRKQDYGTALSVDASGRIVPIPPGSGLSTGHGARRDVVITRLGDDPIHQGMPRRWRTSNLEVYYYARGPAKNVDVLSYAFDPKTRMQWPIEWTVAYGQGRVYVSTFGHVWKGDVQPVSMRGADVQTIMVRALQWLAHRPVTYPVPSDFPTENAVSVRPPFPGLPMPGR